MGSTIDSVKGFEFPFDLSDKVIESSSTCIDYVEVGEIIEFINRQNERMVLLIKSMKSINLHCSGYEIDSKLKVMYDSLEQDLINVNKAFKKDAGSELC